MSEKLSEQEEKTFGEISDVLEAEIPLERFDVKRGELYDFLAESFVDRSMPPGEWRRASLVYAACLVRDFQAFIASSGITASDENEMLHFLRQDEVERIDLCNALTGGSVFDYSESTKGCLRGGTVALKLTDANGEVMEMTDALLRESVLHVYKGLLASDLSRASEQYKLAYEESHG